MLSIKTLCCMLATTLFTQLLIAQNTTRPGQVQKPVVITREGGNFIPMKEAALYTHQFQRDYPNKNFPYAEKFNKELILKLLQQKGAANLRIYLGEDPKSKKIKLVLVAVDDKGIDITKRVSMQDGKLKFRKILYSKANNYYFEDEGLALENGQQCLHMCNINSSPLYQAQ